MQFPIFKTKVEGVNKKFDLNDPLERKLYFEAKAGKKIEKLKEYFDNGNTFVVYLLGKKNSGKGTYAKMFSEVVSLDKIEHFSIGDMIREVDKELKDEKKKKELIDFLKNNYRGWTPVEELISLLEKRSTKTLLPTELILLLTKREIAKRQKKTLFIDGFPRDLDQMNFTLFFRDLIGYRDDPDFFVLIDVPNSVIDERIKSRVVCPNCKTPRNLKVNPTFNISYDLGKKEFYLLCENPKCQSVKMLPKEGDEFGIKPIKERLDKDGKLIEQAIALYGIPKILLKNAIPVKMARDYVDDYEITPEYYYEWNEKEKKVEVKEKPWIVLDDEGEPSYSLLPPPVVLSLINQIVDILNL